MDPELLAGRYELVSTVGKGATGEVWRAVDTVLQRTVAIKLVQLEDARDPAMAERFRREGVAIAGLNHSAIVQVYDTGTDDKRGWLVMELLAGPNTNALVKQQGPVGLAVGLPLLAEVASGLQAAHDQGITHRDVKPANIVLDADPDPEGILPDLMAHPELGRPVLIDFGIARIVDEAGAQLTRPATAIGTAAYMSPEQARGQHVDPPSDVYSLACVTYFLLLGRPPFVADSSIAVAHAQAFDQPVPLGELAPDTPPALDTLVSRMLSKDPAARPTAREVSDELRAILTDPQMAPTVPLVEPPPALTDETAVAQELPETSLQAGAETDEGLTEQLQGTRHGGRWLVGLLVAGLVAALAYSWFAPEPPAPPVPTVTHTTTATQTASAPPTSEPAPPEPGTTLFPPVTDPPATGVPTSPDEPAPPDTTEPTTQPPPTTVPTAPPETTAPPNPTSAQPEPTDTDEPIEPEP